MKRLPLLAILIFGIVSISFAQKSVTPLPVDDTYAFGQRYLVYALPQTAFQVEVTVTKSHAFRGMYADYAEKLLGMSQPITADKVSYSLKSLRINTIEIPDTACLYAVELSSQQLKSGLYSEMLMKRNEAGHEQPTADYHPDNLQIPEFVRNYSGLAYMERSDNYVETQIVDGVVRQIPATRTQKVAKTDAQSAQEAADQIGKIREDRYALLAGNQEVAYSAEALALMIDQLNQMEQNYLSLFSGFVVDEELHYTVTVVPDSNTTRMPIFSLSPTAGFSDNPSKPGETYYLSMQPAPESTAATRFDVSWRCSKGHKPDQGYRVRIPAAAHISVEVGTIHVMDLGERFIYQWGKIDTLPLGGQKFGLETIGFIIY